MKLILPILLVTLQAHSQPAPTGTVTGHVLCADTQRPARLAQVTLVRVPTTPEDKSSHTFGDAAPSGDPVQTSLDGSYTLRNVKPGQYFVVDQEGYLIPLAAFSRKDLASTDAATHARIAAVTHTITVAADQATREDVVLERGAILSGTVHYDDGSPAAGIPIRLLVRDPASKEHKWIAASLGRYHSRFSDDSTDDTGHYRIAGLPPGEYATEDARDVRSIQVENAPRYTPRTHAETQTVATYGNTEQPLQVKGDVSDVLITVPPPPPKPN